MILIMFLDGQTKLSFTEDVLKNMIYGMATLQVKNEIQLMK